MTKAAVRAMDTMTSFCRSLPGSPTVDRFVVSGASKRGWTAWTTAAVDKRVIAVAPLVIDLLNVQKSFEHHFMVYGFWAPAVRDYQAMGIMDNWMGTAEFDNLMRLVEPYSYLDRLTMPKFLINASGDQFFLPDSWKFYWRDLKGEKYIRYVPNTDHSLKNSDVRESLLVFYLSIVRGTDLPEFDWSVERDGEIRVRAKTPAREVKLWQATNAEARDFRLDQIGPAWKSTQVKAVRKGQYRARVSAPEKGWTAYFVEVTFEGPAGVPFKFTSGVAVTPDTTRFPSPLKNKASD
jgi:PhoPQ-activated pathogenicity-related protein